MTGPALAEAIRAPVDADAVEVEVAGLVIVRLVGATAADRAAVEAQLGPARPATARPADITLRYTDEVPLPPSARLVGPGSVAEGDGALVVLQGRYRRPTRVRIPLGDLGESCEVVCEHGVGRVPHLIALVNLALLAQGAVALHASAVELGGRALVATGWAKGGKTEAVLALTGRGHRLVADEWLHLRPDGRASGTVEPLRVWDWQLAQRPDLRAAIPVRSRARLTAVGTVADVMARRSTRAATLLDRQRFLDLPGELVSPAGVRREATPIGPVVLMTSALREDVVATPVDAGHVADRMVASLAYERSPLRALADAHRFAFPGRSVPAVDDAWDAEHDLLRARLVGRVAHEVQHPHPFDLHALADVLEELAGAEP